VVHPFNICARTDNLLLFLVESKSTLIDLSKVTKLKDVAFRPASLSVKWIATTLKTISKHRDLREISIHLDSYMAIVGVGGNIMQVIGEEIWEEWLDLDRLLVQFWESSSIRPKVVVLMQIAGAWNTRYSVGYERFLPEITERGIIDLTS
jgi:hypothetical protein